MEPFSVYVHVPFCLHKCPYCDFNTYAVTQIPDQEYGDALLAELDARLAAKEWQDRNVQTIFFGGGTPSLLSPKTIARFINGLRGRLKFNQDIEITLEANPGSTSYDRLAEFLAAGINRISFGAQSFNDKTLRSLGRIHTSQQIDLAIEDSRAAGFSNINLDLIYGVPDQSMEELSADIQRFIATGVEHISTYHLTIEHGTPFFAAQKRGVIKLPEDDLVVDMMQEILVRLEEGGFKRYEISNFARSNYHSRHNCAYWLGHDYLGLGAGAHSFCRSSSGSLFGARWANFALPKEYINKATSLGAAESWREELSLSDAIFERVFLGMRLLSGVSKAGFIKLFNAPIEDIYGEVLEGLIKQDLIELTPEELKLTPRGLLLADSVISEFAKPCVSNVTTAIPSKL